MTRVGSAFLGQALYVGHIGHFRACEPCERYLHISIANGVLCNGICSSEGLMHGSTLSHGGLTTAEMLICRTRA